MAENSVEITHSPTPWKADSTAISGVELVSIPDDCYWLARLQSVDGQISAKANAEFIVRAVNSHEALLEALRLLVDDVQDYETWQRPCHALDVAKAAISKAEKTL